MEAFRHLMVAEEEEEDDNEPPQPDILVLRPAAAATPGREHGRREPVWSAPRSRIQMMLTSALCLWQRLLFLPLTFIGRHGPGPTCP